MSAGRGSKAGPENPVLVGRISAVYGIKGWVKVHSFTAPESNILDYRPWWLTQGDGWQKLVCDQYRGSGPGANSTGRRAAKPGRARVVHLVGVDDREQAKLYCQRDIYVSGEQLAVLPEGEFYWHQLLDFAVYSRGSDAESGGVRLGTVESLLETGANDVLVVKGDGESGDRRERLIPYIDGVVLNIDPASRRIDVAWDPEF